MILESSTEENDEYKDNHDGNEIIIYEMIYMDVFFIKEHIILSSLEWKDLLDEYLINMG